MIVVAALSHLLLNICQLAAMPNMPPPTFIAPAACPADGGAVDAPIMALDTLGAAPLRLPCA